VAQDIRGVLGTNAYNLQKTSEEVVRRHVQEATRGARPTTYDGDDLSLILVDVGRRDLRTASTAAATSGGAQAAAANTIANFLLNKARTRKAKHGRRNKTGKRHRIVKILGV